MLFNITRRDLDWLMVVPAGLIYFGVKHFIQEEKAFALAAVGCVFYAIASAKWYLRARPRFLIVMSSLALISILAIMVIPIPHYGGPSLIAIPIGLMAGLVMLALITFLEKHDVL
jgi:hypothetical protein